MGRIPSDPPPPRENMLEFLSLLLSLPLSLWLCLVVALRRWAASGLAGRVSEAETPELGLGL